MIDPALLRDHPDIVRDAMRHRGANLSAALEELTALDAERRRMLPEIEGLKREQNAAADEVGRAKREGRDTAPIQEANRARAQRIKALDAELQVLEEKRNHSLLNLPNVPHASVPVGSSAEQNVEVRRHGTQRALSFEPQAH